MESAIVKMLKVKISTVRMYERRGGQGHKESKFSHP